MKKTTKTLGSLSILSAAVMLAGCPFDNDKNDDPVSVAPTPVSVPANLLLTDNRLAAADLGIPADGSVTLGTLQGNSVANNIRAGEKLVSIDRRPLNGQLYALGFNPTDGSVSLYLVHAPTLRVVPISPAPQMFDDRVNGSTKERIGGDATQAPTTKFEIDFNPAVDRLRVISSLGENFRMDPNTGLIVDGAAPNMATNNPGITGIQKDTPLNPNIITNFAATAYTNSQINNIASPVTAQYTVTEGADSQLFLQSNPNGGLLERIGAMTPTLSAIAGLDIAPGVNSSASNTRVTSGTGFMITGTSPQSVTQVNLVSGSIISQNALGNTTGTVGLAIQKPLDVSVVALSADGKRLVRFQAETPTQAATTATDIMGLANDEQLVGIDFRPATGQLIGLAVNVAASPTYLKLYRIDPQSGAAVALFNENISFANTTLPDPTTTDYGVDFNPIPDALRVTTSSGLNLRILVGTRQANQTNEFVDGAINGVTTQAAGAAYTNSFAPATAGMGPTSLYILSSATDALTIQNPPNGGTQVPVANVTLNGAPLNFTAVPGFDIQPEVRSTANGVANGDGYALLTVSGTTNLYRINLTTGAAQLLGTPPGTGFRGLAVGSTGNLR